MASKDRAKPGPTGLLVVDKPLGITSHGVVSRVRRIAGTRQVGHAGTLDPDASGVLVLGLGKATKLLGYIAGSSKEYEATIRLGISTTTDDAEGEIVYAPGFQASSSTDQLLRLETAMERFRGDIEQVPSTVSAIKVDGKRAYARARAGEDVVLKARGVTVDRFEIKRVQPNADGAREPEIEVSTVTVGDQSVSVVDLKVSVECSTGTYVRALARDLGLALGSAGHLTALRRTRVGSWTLEDAVTLETFEQDRDEDLPLISLDDAATRVFPHVLIEESAAARFVHGTAPERSAAIDVPLEIFEADGTVVAVSAKGEPQRVLGLLRTSDGRFKTQNVLVTDLDAGS